MSVVYFLSCVAGKGIGAEAAAAEANGSTKGISPLAIRKLCAGDGGGAAKQLLLPGATPEQRAEVNEAASSVLLAFANALIILATKKRAVKRLLCA